MKFTEQSSEYNHLEKMSINDLLTNINKEDSRVSIAVHNAIPQIEAVVNRAIKTAKNGGRIFYIGAGTSGRLGVLDASEILPTFGIGDIFMGIISGGDKALRLSVENAEDSASQGWKDLKKYQPTKKDLIMGIAASGSTPYVVGCVQEAKKQDLKTACMTCNEQSILANSVDYPIEVIVGPEFVSGSTRMKSGTAQKLVLNMISTSVMIKLGHIKGNKMIDMKLSNYKLVKRATEILISELNISEKKAFELLEKYGSVRKSVESYKSKR